MENSKLLISGVDVWLNNPRRPMEASGTSGEKAAVNGVINFSILDGWWAEGYEEGQNGWAIGDDTEYSNYELQDNADSKSIYNILENTIMPLYYKNDGKGYSKEWLRMMKNSIKSVGGVYNTNRMLCDYLQKLYVPQLAKTIEDYSDSNKVTEFCKWKHEMESSWSNVSIYAPSINEEVTMKAGEKLDLVCNVHLGNIDPSSIACEVFYGKFIDGEKLLSSTYKEMTLDKDLGNGDYEFRASIDIDNGGNYGYTFRVVPSSEMLINKQDMSLVKWIES
jgi:starch phosphorylase